MSQAKLEKFARMANQIGAFHAVMAPEPAAAGVASHIAKFWTPKMIAETLAALDRGDIVLAETAAAGFAILRKTFSSAA